MANPFGAATSTTTVTRSASLAATPPSTADAARFLQQAAFGGNSIDIAAVQALGFSGWLDQQFALTPTVSNWNWLVSQGAGATANQFSKAGIDNALWRSLIAERNQLMQRLALFWSEYFVVSLETLEMAWPQFASAAYMDLLTTNAAGNFRDLLKAVTLSPAMGEYLSLSGSEKADAAGIRHPDENYAREVMQLFTIGLVKLDADGTPALVNGQPVPTYGQADVTGLAAALTGWTYNGSGATPLYSRTPMVQVASRHETAASSFLGTTIPAGTSGAQALETILDTLFHHPNLPPFLARRMIQRLVTSNPSAAYVGRVAAAFVNDGTGVRGNLRATFKAVLLDSEARTAGATGLGRAREPMLRLAQWGRTFAATSTSGAWTIGDTSDAAARLGQSPLRAASVFNFFAPDYSPPGTMLATQGLAAPELQLLDETSVAGYLNWMQHVIANGAGDVTASYAELLPLAGNPVNLVARVNLLLAAGQVPAATAATIASTVAAMPSATSGDLQRRVHAAVFLLMACPSYLVIK